MEGSLRDERPANRREQQAHDLLAKHHCRAVRRGKGWHVVGPGVDLLVCDLGRLTKADLMPVRGRDD
jgi:hypothetical protein